VISYKNLQVSSSGDKAQEETDKCSRDDISHPNCNMAAGAERARISSGRLPRRNRTKTDDCHLAGTVAAH